MTIRDFAERVLFSTSLADKLAAPPDGLTDDVRGPALVTPHGPGRPSGLVLSPSGGTRADFPREHELKNDRARGQLLHFLANHELLATELMALALLKFPDAPAAFRRGLLHTLHEEQLHTQWYLHRMRDYGVEFGELPVSGFFWTAVADMPTPLDYVTRLPLTFEQANLDFSLHYRDVFARAGDTACSELFQRIHDDEISHVAYGLNWFRKWKEPGEADWDAFAKRLVFPLSPVRAKGREPLDWPGRQRAGLDEGFIRHLELFSRSRGRTPVVHWFNPGAETTLSGLESDRPARALAHDLTLLPVFLARSEDIVLVSPAPSTAHLRKLRQLGVALPEIEPLGPDGLVAPDSLTRGRKLGGLRPWAWAPDAGEVLGPLAGNVGGAAHGLAWDDAMRPLFSKQFGARLLHELGRDDFGTTATTLDELRQEVARWQEGGVSRLVIKTAFGQSGRGHHWITALDAATLTWAEAALAAHGALVIEPHYDRVADFSVQGEWQADGTLVWKGFTRLDVDERGRFRACVAGPRFASLFSPEVARFLNGNGDGPWLRPWLDERLKPLLAKHFATHRFRGAFGIDCFVFRHPHGTLGWRPVVEVNPRHTMGRLTLELSRLAAPARLVRFSLRTLVHARAAGHQRLDTYAAALEAANPVRMSPTGRIDRGLAVLNEATHARRFLAVVEVTEVKTGGAIGSTAIH